MNTPDSNAFTGHTPGPWVLNEHNHVYVGGEPRYAFYKEDGIERACRTGLIALPYSTDGLPHESNHAANARLIAAAPTLLAERDELKTALEWCIHQFEGDSGTGASHWEQYAEYVAAKALLSRLNGKATP